MESYQIVKFYSSVDDLHHNKDVAQGRISPIIAANGYFPPFQFITEDGGETSVYIYPVDRTGMPTGTAILDSVLTMKEVGTGIYAGIYYGNQIANVPRGLYIFRVIQHRGPATKVYHSDLIQATDDVGLLKLEFWHHEDLEIGDWRFDMASNFKFRAYLRPSSIVQDVIGKPIYVFEENVTRRAGYNFVISAISTKRYVFETLVTEPIMDGLRMAKIMSNRQYTVKGVTKQVWDMAMNPVWEDVGYLAILTIEFDPTDTVVMTVGKYRPDA